MTESEFEVDVMEDHARRFAEPSGDWNLLHTDLVLDSTLHLVLCAMITLLGGALR